MRSRVTRCSIQFTRRDAMSPIQHYVPAFAVEVGTHKQDAHRRFFGIARGHMPPIDINAWWDDMDPTWVHSTVVDRARSRPIRPGEQRESASVGFAEQAVAAPLVQGNRIPPHGVDVAEVLE